MHAKSRIEIKSPAEIEKMRKAGKLLRAVFVELERHIQPGITTAELDTLARKLIEDAGAIPAFLGYEGYPATLCTSVNEEIVHGIPRARVLREGDIVAVDCGLILGGFYADSAYTYPVGQVSDLARRLIEVTKAALGAGIREMRPDNRLGTLSAAIQKVVEEAGFSIVREYTGHGIGRAMHEPPQVLNFGTPNTGLRLRPGMVFAIEPMVNAGTWKTRVLDDDWTVVTADGSLSAHFEHTVAVTDDGPDVLTA
ncbi:MAG: type I methionyl aminopeptidase [Candidatus Sumerlaeaceae bacterium]|jgi:methionyl aminopeptidase